MMKLDYFLFYLVALVVFILGCVGSQNSNSDVGTGDTSESGDSDSLYSDDVDTLIEGDEAVLSQFQIEACNAADAAGTCDTKLRDLAIVSKAECCDYVSKCC